jgi:hypothetical protein
LDRPDICDDDRNGDADYGDNVIKIDGDNDNEK